ncbi:hypothetical protein CDES_13810 [Corynebacterium deserti GIMN1.010]|uniref:Uncharacterized protein n=1 Tax=Corynebacterium deserti GIMN1.010 TaxID=931089 RepID=A0A0M3QA98_9CORY|nr:hypothetical protein [Corynebacterium deserti]ALC07089.1 hypothetical protein CDES_13810 [Corynebacterium deserti GIMN1.010]
MFDQIQHFTEAAQHFQPSQWGFQMAQQLPQQVQEWFHPQVAQAPERPSASLSS